MEVDGEGLSAVPLPADRREIDALVAKAMASGLRLFVLAVPTRELTASLPLTRDQQRAVEMRASGCSITVVAQRLGRARKTIYAWMRKNRNFRVAMEAARCGRKAGAHSGFLQVDED